MFRKILLALLILSLAIPVYAGNYVAGDVIVVYKSGAKLSSVSLASSTGAMVKRVYPALAEVNGDNFVLLHSDDADPEEFARELLKDPNVIAASPNYIARLAVTPNDTRYSDLWGMNQINMPSAWEKTTGSNNVYVAIVDTGIDWTNPDISANVDSSLGFNYYNSSEKGFDDEGHGTHVAGTIGAVGNNNLGVAGVNWSVKMIPVKVFTASGQGTDSSILAGLNHVAGLLSQGYNIRAINLSLALYSRLVPTHDNLVKDPLWRAFKVIDDYNKAVIVVAAGNESVKIGQPTTTTKYESGVTVFTPGCYVYPPSFNGLNNMISVSACGRNGTLSSYSNTSADMTAPGGDYTIDGSTILSTGLQSSSSGASVASMQGTSMATPHVAGAAALLAANRPNMTAYQIKTCLLQSRNMNYAEGLLDVAAALNYQENSGSSVQDEGSEDYSDWQNYNANSGSNIWDVLFGGGDGGSGGGCDGFMWGAIGVIILFPLVKKFMS